MILGRESERCESSDERDGLLLLLEELFEKESGHPQGARGELEQRRGLMEQLVEMRWKVDVQKLLGEELIFVREKMSEQW